MSTNEVHVGNAPRDFEDWTSTKVYLHGFADLSTASGESVESPKFSCFGHQWVLRLYPAAGRIRLKGMLISLGNRSNKSIKIQYCYCVRDSNCKEVVYMKIYKS